MRSETRRRLLWQVLGILCYIGGLVIFLSAFVAVYFGPPANSLANFGRGHGIAMFFAVTLLVVGRWISYRFGGLDVTAGALSETVFESGPEPTQLEQMGYRIDPDDVDQADDGYAYDDGDVLLVCPECGARNEPSYRFCSVCSEELPE